MMNTCIVQYIKAILVDHDTKSKTTTFLAHLAGAQCAKDALKKWVRGGIP